MYKTIYFSSDYCFPDNVNPNNQEQLTKYYLDNKEAIHMGKFDAEFGINWDFIENLIQEEVNPIDHSKIIEP